MLFPTRKVLLVSGAMLAGIVSLMPAPSGTAATVVAPRPQQTIIVGTESGAAVLQVLNLGTGGAVIGQVGASEIGAATGAGLYGVFDPPSGVGEGVLGFASNGTGIVAETFGGAYAAIYAQNYSSAAEPAIQGVSNGNSIVGTSADSNSIVGITNDPTHGGSTAAGVLGEDGTSQSYISNNDGVLGTTLSGDWGVEGTSNNSALGGVHGSATTGYGVEGNSDSGWGVYGISGTADGGHFVSSAASGESGVAGISTNGNGIYGRNQTAGSTPAPTGNVDVGASGNSTQGTGVYGYSANNNGGWFENDQSTNCCGAAVGGADGVDSQGPYALYAQADNADGFPLGAFNSSTGEGFLVNEDGSIFLSGTVNSSYSGFSQTRNPNTDMATYSAQETEATVEDVGTAQVVNGGANVPLSPDFRQTIDGASTYMVFLTPDGDAGLYVASKSPAGFVVRELNGGHATLAFDYRIVARPYGTRQARLPHHPEFARMFAHRGARANFARPTDHETVPLAALATTHMTTHKNFAVNHVPAGPPPSARTLSAQFRLR